MSTRGASTARRLLALGCVAAAACAAHARDLFVPLKVTEPTGVARTSAPVRGGVPIGPLKIENLADLVLVSDPANLPIPAQLSPMVTNPDGTREWALVEFLTDMKPNETKGFRLGSFRQFKPTAPRDRLAVELTADSITMSNRFVKVVLSAQRFNLFEQVWRDDAGTGAFTDDRKMLAGDDAPALLLVRGADKAVFSTRDGKVDTVSLEDPGPVRTTVRIDGSFGDGGGNHWLKYTARVTMWADSPNVRVLYTLRNVNPQLEQQEQVRRGTVTLRLAQASDRADYIVGGAVPNMSRLSKDERGTPKGSQWHHTVQLSQVGPPEAVCGRTHRQFYNLKEFEDAGYRVRQFQPGDRRPVVDVGFKSGGWINLATSAGGCLLWLRNFTYDTPKRMEAKVDGTMTVDLIPEYDGDRQPYYATGGYWLGDRSHWSYDLTFHFHRKSYLTDADWKQWGEQFSNYVPPTAETAAKLNNIVAAAADPLVLVSTPEWYTRTGAMWGVVPSPADELAAAKAMGRTKIGPVRPQPASALATEFLHYENFHYRSEWDEPGDAILEFLRTGEWHFYKRANSFGRNYRDVGVPRTDGLALGQRKRGAWGAGPIERWGKFCGCHNYGSGLIDLWLVTGDRSYREAGVELGLANLGGGYGGFGSRDWGRRMTSIIRAYQVTRDPKMKAYLIAHCRPPVPNDALRADGRALICGKQMASWMVGLCGHAIWHNWVLHESEYRGIEYDDYRDQIIGLGRQVAKYWWFEDLQSGPYHFQFDSPAPGAVTTQGGGISYTLSCIDMMTRAYLLTGDPKLLAAAKKFWDACNGPDKTTLRARLQDFLGMGSHSFWARQLVYELAHPRQDATPPSRVADLQAEALGGGKVRLTWAAPADRDGTVAAYQVKHAPCPLVTFEEYEYPRDRGQKWTWWAGYNVVGEPQPGRPGVAETMTVEGVPTGVRYFCLVSRDAASNESALSNVARADVK